MARAKNEHNKFTISSEGGMQAMINQVFGTLHETLDDIIIHYPYADAEQKQLLDEKLAVLKQFSDSFIEHWLQFEEKMADFRDMQSGQLQVPAATGASAAVPTQAELECLAEAEKYMLVQHLAPGKAVHAEPESPLSADDPDQTASCEAFIKGQGYFKLFMFKEAAACFMEALLHAPEYNEAKLFLAMSLMHLQEWQEAQRHFQLLIEVTDNAKWRALGLNALGCIQAIRLNLEQAERYFARAHESDPDFPDPVSNIKSCQQHTNGHLSLYFGSGQL
ncbi:tetratricopeptide repeat protein [Paenibacillus nasutitermitis]|uniref:Tetratricopeptide repeat protein n=1 Tax=Paenibacillus nasutitermitis TaxID=1652958 RepID=A0A917DU27_9BACL|nr:tetratricopeptide repeat protein [Paenibacillus nasutitermitis]GGD68931.1 hypothetical protein GCM10010911_28410 [Paenibacillus nasutitermitis]